MHSRAAADTIYWSKNLADRKTPSVGFAAGIERLLMAMEKANIYKGKENNPTVFIASADEASRNLTLSKATELRRIGIPCEIDMLNRSLKSQMREADRQKVKYVVIIGQDELKSEQVSVKDMKTGEQTTMRLNDLITFLRKV
jgi:histidyl-tRNA synthetase